MDESFPDISDIFPAASRMQRAAHDLFGVSAANSADQRKWLRHAAWREGMFPTAQDVRWRLGFCETATTTIHSCKWAVRACTKSRSGRFTQHHRAGAFPLFRRWRGILRLEERSRLQTQRHLRKRFEQMDLEQGARLAGRVSGDSTAAYAWAYAMAVESACSVTPAAASSVAAGAAARARACRPASVGSGFSWATTR